MSYDTWVAWGYDTYLGLMIHVFMLFYRPELEKWPNNHVRSMKVSIPKNEKQKCLPTHGNIMKSNRFFTFEMPYKRLF